MRKWQPAKLIVAVPVAPSSSLTALRCEADEVVCLEDYEVLGAIGYFYEDFRQVSDRDVKDILARFPADRAAGGGVAARGPLSFGNKGKNQ